MRCSLSTWPSVSPVGTPDSVNHLCIFRLLQECAQLLGVKRCCLASIILGFCHPSGSVTGSSLDHEESHPCDAVTSTYKVTLETGLSPAMETSLWWAS